MTTVISYKLRAGSPQPAIDPAGVNYFILQTFGAETQESTQCEDKEQLLQSDDMQGLGGLVYQSANYRGKEVGSFLDGSISVQVFDAEENKIPVFVDEDLIGISGGMFTP